MKLYEIAAEYRRIDELLDESGGEVTPAIEAAMDAAGGTLGDKVDGYCALVRELLAEEDAVADEAARMMERARAIGNKARRLKAYLLTALKAAGVPRVKTPRFTVWAQTASKPTVAWAGDPNDLPPEFRRVRVEPNVAAAQEYYAAHGTLPDGFRVTHTEFLQVR